MKTTRISLFGLMGIALLSCSKSDDSTPPKIDPDPDPVNQAPAAFDLLTAADGAEGVDVLPTLTWETATDPDGDTVSYDVFLDGSADPTTLLSGAVGATTVTGTERLHFLTPYNWKVVAKDTEGATTASGVFGFTTRGLRVPATATVEAAAFSPKIALSSVAFGDKLWVIGGRDSAGFQEEVWSTSDGAAWSLVTEEPGFLGRASHTTAVFQDKMWVMGGTSIREVAPTPENPSGDEQYYMNDVWSSTNGTDWVELTSEAAFAKRDGLTSAVLGDRLFVMGGYDGTYMNDVWSTTDGEVWEQVVASAEFSARSGHTTVVFDDKIWVIGGWDGTKRLNDVWYSADGVTWTQATGAAEFSARVNPTAAVFDGKLWVIAGYASTTVNDIWYSADGITWEQATGDETFPIRGDHATAVFDNKIWVIGGNDGSLNQKYNDVWALD